MSKLTYWNDSFQEYIAGQKTKLALSFLPNTMKFLSSIMIHDAAVKTRESANSKVSTYFLTLDINGQLVTIYRKAFINGDEQEITRWRYEPETFGLEMTLETFLVEHFELSKREATKIEEMFEDFNFMKVARELEREKAATN